MTAANGFRKPDKTEPATDGLAITPNDSAEITTVCRAFIPNVSGTCKVDTVEGTTLTVPVVAGHVYPLTIRKVHNTDTDSTSVIGLI